MDADFEDKLNLNFDITINTPCFGIGADIIDSSGDAWRYMIQINEEAAEFQLDDRLEQERLNLVRMKESIVNDGGLSKGRKK